jgi:prepilin-type N-terminal cleavage/methylation domain-containing protein
MILFSRKDAGFTLVELAVVITIVALLIGGVLKGQEMVQNAKITSTISQVQSYKAAATTYADSHGGALPGDARRSVDQYDDGDVDSLEDGIIGFPDWGTNFNYRPNQYKATAPCPPHQVCPAVIEPSGHEANNFWLQLSQAGLISGITGTGTGWGLSHPAAGTGGGFVVGYMDSTTPQGFPGTEGPIGNALMMAQDLTDESLEQKPLLVKRAAQFDRRIDDGIPTSGSVVAYGENATCFSGDGSKPGGYIAGTYAEDASNTRDCGLFFLLN